MTSIPVGGPIQVGAHIASIDAKYGPYATKQAAIEALGENGMDVIADGLTVGIIEEGKIVEYWFQGGVTEAYLLRKSSACQVELNSIVKGDTLPEHCKGCAFSYNGEAVFSTPVIYDNANCLLVFARVAANNEIIEKTYLLAGRTVLEVWETDQVPASIKNNIPTVANDKVEEIEDILTWE